MAGPWDAPPTNDELRQVAPDPWAAPPSEDELAGASKPDVASALRTLAQATAEADPKKQIAIRQLSQSTGVPSAIVASKVEAFQRHADVAGVDWTKVADRSPALAKAIRNDPALMPILRDDVSRLSGLEWMLTGKTDEVTGRYTPSAWMAALDKGAKEQRLILAQTREAIGAGDDQNRDLIRQLQRESSVDLGADSLLSKAWLVVPKMATMLGGAAIAGAVGNLPGIGVYFGYQAFGPAFWREKEKGDAAGKPGEVLPRAIAAGEAGVQGVLGAFGMAPALGLVSKVPGVAQAVEKAAEYTIGKALATVGVRKVLTDAATAYGSHYALGVATMGAQAGLSEAFNQAGNASLGLEVHPQAILDRTWEATQTAMVDMAVLGAWAPARELVSDIGRQRAAEVDRVRYEAMVQGATDSTLLERAPQEFQRLMQAAKDAGGVKAFYIPVEQFDRYWTEQKLSEGPRKMAAELLQDGGKAYDEAKATNGDVAIPSEVFLTQLAKNHGQALAPDVKLAQDGMTWRQLELVRERIAERVKEGAKLEPDKMEVAQRAVYEDFLNKARVAGRDIQEADAVAKQISAVYQTLAEDHGTTADELYRRTANISFGTPVAPEMAKAAQANVEGSQVTLSSPERGSVRFGVNFPSGAKDYIVTLGPKADRSTLAHETFHIVTDVLHRLGTEQNAPEALRRDLDVLSKWMGYATPADRQTESQERLALAAKDEAGTLTSGDRDRLRELTAKEERSAHAWEQYLAEGKAPTVEMAGVFRRFANWMKSLYGGIQGINDQFKKNFQQEIGLTDEVRGVFDRLLGQREQLAAAEHAAGARPLPEVLAAMTPAERKKYDVLDAEARTEAEQNLATRIDAANRREDAKWYRDEESRIAAEVSAELDKDPAYRAMEFFKTGKTDALPPWVTAELTEIVDGKLQPFKLDRRVLQERYGPWFVETLPKGVLAKKGTEGVDADYIAERIGFHTGEEMLFAIRDIQPRERKIAGIVAERMADLYGRPLFSRPEEFFDAAMGAVHNEKQFLKALEELHFFERKIAETQGKGGFNASIWRAPEVTPQQIRAIVDGIVAGKSYDQLGPKRFLQAERAAARSTWEAAKAEKWNEARDAAEARLVNMELYRAAEKARDQADKDLSVIRRLTDDAARAKLGKVVSTQDLPDGTTRQTQPYLDAVDTLLDGFELGKGVSKAETNRRARTKEWMDREIAAGRDPIIPDSVLEKLDRATHWKDLTPGEIKDLRDAVESIAHQAQRKATLRTAKGDREFAGWKEEAIQRLTQTIDVREISRVPRLAPVGERAATLARKAEAVAIRPEFLIEKMDGGESGPWHDGFWNPLSDAYNTYRDYSRELQRSIVDRMEALPAETKKRFRDEIFTVKGQKYSLEQSVVFALNWGNKSNRAKVLAGENHVRGQNLEPLTEADIVGMMRRLPPEAVSFINETWKAISSRWSDMEAMEQRLTGLAPKKVEPTPFTIQIPDGAELKFDGGYYPMIYDPGFSGAGARQAERLESGGIVALAFDPGYTRAVTPQGHLQARVENYARPVSLSLNSLEKHIDATMKDLAMRESLIQLRDILVDRELHDAMRTTIGDEGIKVLQGVWRDAANELVIPDTGWGLLERGMNWTRTQVAGAIFGLNVGQWLQNLTGFANTLDRVPARYVKNGLWQVVHDRGDAFGKAQELSAEMRLRSENMNRDVGDSLKQLTGQTGHLARAKETFLLAWQTTDKLVSTTAWLGAYEHALAPAAKGGMELGQDAAIRHADNVVRTSIMSGRTIDLPSYMRARQFKLVTMFAGWGNIQLNQAMRAWNQRGVALDAGAGARAYSRLIKTMVFLGAGAAMSEVLTGKAPKSDDDGIDASDWAKWMGTKAAIAPVLWTPIIGSVARGLDTGREASFTPWSRVLESGTKAISAGWKLGENYQENGDFDPELLSRAAALTLESAAYFTGMPAAQGRAVAGYLSNRSGDESLGEDAMGVAFGKKRQGKLINAAFGE